MIGTLVNSAAILVGGALGLLLHKVIGARIADSVMRALGLMVVLLGIQGGLTTNNALVPVISIAAGAALGSLIRIQDGISALSDKIMGHGDDKRLAEGFLTATLLFCTGAMAITGALDDGFSGDHTTLFTKAILDGISALMLAATLGAGVLFSAVSVLVYQGVFALLAGVLVPLIPDATITEMGAVGGVLLIGVGLNMLGVTKLKVMDYIPSIFLPILVCMIM